MIAGVFFRVSTRPLTPGTGEGQPHIGDLPHKDSFFLITNQPCHKRGGWSDQENSSAQIFWRSNFISIHFQRCSGYCTRSKVFHGPLSFEVSFKHSGSQSPFWKAHYFFCLGALSDLRLTATWIDYKSCSTCFHIEVQ